MEGAPLVRCMTWENASTVMGLSAIIWKRDGLDCSISHTPGGWSCSSDFRQPACDHTCVHVDNMEGSLGCSCMHGQSTA